MADTDYLVTIIYLSEFNSTFAFGGRLTTDKVVT